MQSTPILPTADDSAAVRRPLAAAGNESDSRTIRQNRTSVDRHNTWAGGDIVDEIKRGLDIVDIISRSTTLTPNGRRGVEHDSLKVDAGQQRFDWWSKGWHGDVLDWLGRQRYGDAWQANGMMFREVLEEAAREAGVELSPQDNEAAEERRRIEEIFEMATAFYVSQLTPERRAKLTAQYGYSEETIDQFQLGYAPGERATRDLLHREGLDFEQRLATGLVNNGDYDVFDHRVVFPYIVDGRVRFFAARRTDQTPSWQIDGKEVDQPKYLKLKLHSDEHPEISPAIEHPLWQYGRFAGQNVHIAEGIPDAVAAAGHGLNVITPGTVQFRHEDLVRLAERLKSARRVFITPDNEESGAGLKGALRTAEALWKMGVRLRIVTLPRPELPAAVEQPIGTEPPSERAAGSPTEPRLADKIDLAEFLRDNGLDAYLSLCEEAKTLLDLRVAEAKQANGDAYVHALRAMFGLLADLDDPAEQMVQKGAVTKALGLGRRDYDRMLTEAHRRDDTAAENDDRYIVVQGALHDRQTLRDGSERTQPLCNFTARITCEIVRDDGSGCSTRAFLLSGTLASGEPLPEAEVAAEEFEDMRWCTPLWGHGRSLSPDRRRPCAALQVSRSRPASSAEQCSRIPAGERSTGAACF